jgi:hypothetical protein
MKIAGNILLIIAGTVIAWGAMHVSITALGGYAEPQAHLVIVMFAAIVAGALAVAYARRMGQPVVASTLAASIFIGEGYLALLTLERAMRHQEAIEEPIRHEQLNRGRVTQRLDEARVTLALTSTPRLERALDNQQSLLMIAAKAAERRTCSVRCMADHEQRTDAAAAEVRAARDELASRQQAAAVGLQEAEQELASMPAPRTISPLADVLGWLPWQVSAIRAMMLSLALNLPAAIMIYLGAHTLFKGDRIRSQWIITNYRTPREAEQHLERFSAACLVPREGGAIRIEDLGASYAHFCEFSRERPMSDFEAGMTYQRLLTATEADGYDGIIHGAAVEPKRLADLRRKRVA